MPFYDLRCAECEHAFRTMSSMTERSQRQIPCPECGSHELEAVFHSAPAYIKSLKAPACPNISTCGGGCRHS